MGEENRDQDGQERPSSCHDMGEENRDQDRQEQPSSCPDAGEENREQDGQEMAAAAVAEERGSAKENQTAVGGHGGEEESWYVYCMYIVSTH